MSKIVDTRVDPGTLSVFSVLLEECHEVIKVDGLPGRYGFSLSETPEYPTILKPSIHSIYYIDHEEFQIPLIEADVTLFDLHENQFSCNYGDLESSTVHGSGSRNFRIGQVFVNEALLGHEVIIKYHGLGSTVNTLNMSPPIGYVYTQYPFCPSPKEMYPQTNWSKMTDLYPNLKGAFFRSEGGMSSIFQSGVQEDSAPNITGVMGSERGVFTWGAGAIYPDWGHPEKVWVGSGNATFNKNLIFDASRSSTTYGKRSEVAPRNFTVILWKRTR